MKEMIYLIKNKAAVDATILTKDKLIPEYANSYGIPLKNIAVIGDGITDIPLLETPGLGLVGAPANSQERVKELVSGLPNGWVSSKQFLDAFLEFYDLAKQKGISHIISDRDGVLVWKGDLNRGGEYRQLLQSMGLDGNPFIAILTGSAVSQNEDFMKAYSLCDPNLRSNPAIIENPYLLLAENGLIHINVITGEKLNFCERFNPNLLNKLKNDFEPEVTMKIKENVLIEFGLGWSDSYGDQDGKIYVPPKEGMTTFNIPRSYHGKDYRNSKESEILRDSILKIMADTAEKMDIPYKIL